MAHIYIRKRHSLKSNRKKDRKRLIRYESERREMVRVFSQLSLIDSVRIDRVAAKDVDMNGIDYDNVFLGPIKKLHDKIGIAYKYACEFIDKNVV